MVLSQRLRKYGNGNNVNALNLARQAQSMDPGNPEYANLVNRLSGTATGIRAAAITEAVPEELPAVPEICAVIFVLRSAL